MNRVPAGVSIQYKQGVMIDKSNTNPIDWTTGEGAKADAVIACIGLTWLLEGEEGEAIASAQRGDMIDNSVPKAQIDFLVTLKKKLASQNKPLIVIVSGGCPVQLNLIREIADALILAWYPGEAGGNAIADIVLGNANPSGRTPVTFVKSLKQLPDFEDYSMKNRTYRYMTEEPLYPFGYGLSYSNFEYDELYVPDKAKAGEEIVVGVTVSNTSCIAGEEVVQLYLTDDDASVPVPVRQLAAFKRVFLNPGESKRMSLTIPVEKFSLITDKNRRKIESGYFTISVGGGQPVSKTKSYVTKKILLKGDKELEL